MLKYLLFSGAFIGTIICGCTNKSSTQLPDRKDTVQLITTCFQSPKILPSLNSNADTIEVLKSALTQEYGPSHIRQSTLKYIEDTESARQPNVPWIKKKNNHVRVQIKILHVGIDSAKTQFDFLDSATEYKFALKKEKGEWKIVDTGISMQ